jgi:hypothetical protein
MLRTLTKAEERILQDLWEIGGFGTARDIANHRGSHWRAACGIGKSLFAISQSRPDLLQRPDTRDAPYILL